MAETIDAFAHILPPEFHEEMSDVHPTDALENLYFEQLWDVETRLADMDEHGIDRQVLTLANPPIWRGMSPEEALPLTRLANDLVREVADEHPDRFIPVATLPFATEGYVEEFERALNDLDMHGAQIFSNVDGRPIDSPGHMDVYEVAAESGAPIWIHPQLYEWYDWLDEYELHRTFGWPFDTTVAMTRLVFAGVFERYPDLEVVTHHLGGMIPYYIGRLSTFYEARMNNPDLYPDFEAPEFSTSIEEQFRNFYGDTVVGGNEAALACGRSFFGDENVLYGTDYPFGPDRGARFMKQSNEVLESVEDASTRAAMRSGNVRSLLQ